MVSRLADCLAKCVLPLIYPVTAAVVAEISTTEVALCFHISFQFALVQSLPWQKHLVGLLAGTWPRCLSIAALCSLRMEGYSFSSVRRS